MSCGKDATTSERLSIWVVCDQFPDRLQAPFSVDGNGMLRRVDSLEREVPLP